MKKSSTSGLTSTDICNILESATKAGVKHFSYRVNGADLEFVLGNEPIALTPASSLYDHSTIEESAEIGDNDDDAVSEKDPIDMSELMISDPVEYERLLHGKE